MTCRDCSGNCRQGRDCPHRTSILDNPKFIMIAAMMVAPFICLWMIVRHPVITYKVWREHGSGKQREAQQAYPAEGSDHQTKGTNRKIYRAED